jgi:hypothetical protein
MRIPTSGDKVIDLDASARNLGETIPNIQFEAGKLHPDSLAAAAIKALPPGPLADQLAGFETRLLKATFVKPWKRSLRSRIAWWIAGPELRICRGEIAILAVAAQKMMLDEKARKVEQHFNSEYERLAKDMRGLRKFFLEQFPIEMANAEAVNKPLLDLAREIMMRGR